MTQQTRTIELDEPTALALKQRATERGLSVSQLVSELLAGKGAALAESEQLAELDRRWAAVQAGGVTIDHREVVRWLETWGSPAFKPWSDR